ncbi:hypothetical protein T4C_3338 [Trichinella pseudospiralis]|uniref:Uncharacterized protein n=1 Tax=Trichinella pseudospiralis TaxID=6337 RepID=A0A0V1JTH9_TRIPS|nr:hypothetical protein T4C_3338 [Trichinella pseudospiralis]
MLIVKDLGNPSCAIANVSKMFTFLKQCPIVNVESQAQRSALGVFQGNQEGHSHYHSVLLCRRIEGTGELCALVPYWRTFIGEDNIAGLICPEDGNVGECPMLGLRLGKPPSCERLVPVINATGLPRGEPQPWVCIGNFGQLFSG